MFAPTEQLHGTLLSSSFPALNDPAVAIDIYRGDTGLDTGGPSRCSPSIRGSSTRSRLKVAGSTCAPVSRPARRRHRVRFDGAVPFINVQVSHDPAQVWVLVFALTMMAGPAGLWWCAGAGSGLNRTRWCGYGKRRAGRTGPHRQLGWGDEFERLTQRLLDGLDTADVNEKVAMNTEHIDIGLARYSDWAFTSSVVVL